MAEPTGFFTEVEIEEQALNKLLNHPFPAADFKPKVGYFFSGLLYETKVDPSNVFIFSYDKKNKKCFMAYLLNHFGEDMIRPFNDLFDVLCALKSQKSTEYALVATTYPEVLHAFELTKSGAKEGPPDVVPPEVVEHLSNKFWSFSEGNTFPSVEKALNKRNYFYKNFKNYYKRYLGFIEEKEKPDKIAKATKESPFKLFGSFFSYDGKVFEFRNHTNQVIEIPQADPLTFRDVSGIKADKNHVYLPRLAQGSPPARVGGRNNPDAVWEYYIVEGMDGASFNYVKEKWDTIYWKDKNAVYVYRNKQLIKVEGADSKTFKYLDFCYGKDKNQLFYYEKGLPVNPNDYTLNKNGFLFDDEHVFHYANRLPLHAPTFKVLKYGSTVNPHMGTFVLEDKNGTYEYNRDWPENKLKRL